MNAKRAKKLMQIARHYGEEKQVCKLVEELGEATSAASEVLMRLSFRGDVANEPIIAKLARDYNLEVSILYGTVDFIQGVSFGKLIIDVSGSDSNITAAFNHLHSLPIESEVLGYVSGNI